ncbi:MAG: hypothetical protein JEZ08_25565 [Clostridiales bacterium]|nr:hypothetical protein [Clostridiales bacterium]
MVVIEVWVKEQNTLGVELSFILEVHFSNNVSHSKASLKMYSIIPLNETINVVVSKGESYVVADLSVYNKPSIESWLIYTY